MPSRKVTWEQAVSIEYDHDVYALTQRGAYRTVVVASFTGTRDLLHIVYVQPDMRENADSPRRNAVQVYSEVVLPLKGLTWCNARSRASILHLCK